MNIRTIEYNLIKYTNEYLRLSKYIFKDSNLNKQIQEFGELLDKTRKTYERFKDNTADNIIIQEELYKEYSLLSKMSISIERELKKYNLNMPEKKIELNSELKTISNQIRLCIDECERLCSTYFYSRDLHNDLLEYDTSIGKTTDALIKCDIHGLDYNLNFCRLKEEYNRMITIRERIHKTLEEEQNADLPEP